MKTYGFLVTELRNISANYRVIDSPLKNVDPCHNEYMAKPPTAIKEDSQSMGKNPLKICPIIYPNQYVNYRN